MTLVRDQDAQQVRLVNDETAPAARFLNPDETHPYRQKELIPEIIKRLSGKARPTTHQIQCVRRIHETDKNPTFTYAPRFGSPQYSAAFADWVAEQFLADPDFFKAACAEHLKRQAQRTGKRKPR